MSSLKHVFNELVNTTPRLRASKERLTDIPRRISESSLVRGLILPETISFDDDVPPQEFQPIYGPPIPDELKQDNSYGFTQGQADALIDECFDSDKGQQ